MISACRLTMECKLVKTVQLEVDAVYFGEVVTVYADKEALTDGNPDWAKINPLTFTFPDKAYRNMGDKVAKAWSVGKVVGTSVASARLGWLRRHSSRCGSQ